MAVTFNKFNCFSENLAEKVHNLGSDQLRLALTNSAPVATNTVIGDITQIAGSNGYTTGGLPITVTTSSQSSGVYRLIASDPVVTCVSATMGTFRYGVVYNDTASNDELIGWFDHGAAIIMSPGDTYTPDFDGTNGIISIT